MSGTLMQQGPTQQEKVYRELVALVAQIAREGFGVDVIHNSTYAAIFEAQLHKFHPQICHFIELMVPPIPPGPPPDVQGTVDKLAASFRTPQQPQYAPHPQHSYSNVPVVIPEVVGPELKPY